MDFFRHQAEARRKSIQLVLYYLLAVGFLVASVYLLAAFLVRYFGASYVAHYSYRAGWWDPVLFAWVAFAVVATVLVGSVYKTLQLRRGGAVVARSLGAIQVGHATGDPLERRLLNVVEEMAIASGCRVPEVYVLPAEQGINAFAAGLGGNDSVIAVTRGALESLSRDELQGVVGHEFSHILHGDNRLNLKLIGILHGILLVGLVGKILLAGGRTQGAALRFSARSRGGGLAVLGLALWLIGSLGLLFGRLIKAAVSRQREFLADASSVQYTRNPAGIAGALKKIGGIGRGATLVAPRAEEASHLFFADILTSHMSSLLATHPPLAERIRRIEPRFDSRRLAAERPAVGPRLPEDAWASMRGAAGLAYRQVPDLVGTLDPVHLAQAERLLASLPARLRRAAETAFSACALIYGLLLDTEPEVRAAQVDHLKRTADSRVLVELQGFMPDLKRLVPEQRLPLVDLALAALRALTPVQYQEFRRNVGVLIEADQRLSLFEYALKRLVFQQLDGLLLKAARPGVPGNRRLEAVAGAAGVILAALARAAAREPETAREAYAAAQAEMGAVRLPPFAALPERIDFGAVDRALDQLAALGPEGKQRLLTAAAASVAHDGKVTVEEGELLRVVAFALDLPLPAVAVACGGRDDLAARA